MLRQRLIVHDWKKRASSWGKMPPYASECFFDPNHNMKMFWYTKDRGIDVKLREILETHSPYCNTLHQADWSILSHWNIFSSLSVFWIFALDQNQPFLLYTHEQAPTAAISEIPKTEQKGILHTFTREPIRKNIQREKKQYRQFVHGRTVLSQSIKIIGSS